MDGGNTEHSNTVDGWNAWYYSDLDRLNHAWSRHPTKPGRVGANRTSVTELWIGFLSYYAYDFDDKNLVVSVRTTSKLTKFEKMWNLPTIAIEDPFDLGHNLGAGLHRRSKSVDFSGQFRVVLSILLFSSERLHQESLHEG